MMGTLYEGLCDLGFGLCDLVYVDLYVLGICRYDVMAPPGLSGLV